MLNKLRGVFRSKGTSSGEDSGSPPLPPEHGAEPSPTPSGGDLPEGTQIRILGSPKVYVAGPYSKGDVCKNVSTAIMVADLLMKEGYRVYVPHLSHFQHLLNRRNYWDWLEHGIGWMMDCNAILLLPGRSFGANLEVQIAERLGIPVFTDVKSLCAAMPVRLTPRPHYEEYITP